MAIWALDLRTFPVSFPMTPEAELSINSDWPFHDPARHLSEVLWGRSVAVSNPGVMDLGPTHSSGPPLTRGRQIPKQMPPVSLGEPQSISEVRSISLVREVLKQGQNTPLVSLRCRQRTPSGVRKAPGVI